VLIRRRPNADTDVIRGHTDARTPRGRRARQYPRQAVDELRAPRCSGAVRWRSPRGRGSSATVTGTQGSRPKHVLALGKMAVRRTTRRTVGQRAHAQQYWRGDDLGETMVARSANRGTPPVFGLRAQAPAYQITSGRMKPHFQVASWNGYSPSARHVHLPRTLDRDMRRAKRLAGGCMPCPSGVALFAFARAPDL